MQIRDILGYIFLPLVLIIAGSATRWGFAYESPFSWFCWSFAIALLVIGGTSLVFQIPPGQIPARGMWLVYIASLLLLGAELVVAYLESGSRPMQQWPGAVHHGSPLRMATDWVVFAVLLLVLFWIPRSRRDGVVGGGEKGTSGGEKGTS